MPFEKPIRGLWPGYLTEFLRLPEARLTVAVMTNVATGEQQAGVAHKIELVLAPAVQTLDARLAAGEAASYDFAFIDADKSNYDAYYERCLPLLRKGGLIALDNMLWGGSVARPAKDADTAALQALNAKLHRDERVDVSLLTIGDGLTLARKR